MFYKFLKPKKPSSRWIGNSLSHKSRAISLIVSGKCGIFRFVRNMSHHVSLYNVPRWASSKSRASSIETDFASFWKFWNWPSTASRRANSFISSTRFSLRTLLNPNNCFIACSMFSLVRRVLSNISLCLLSTTSAVVHIFNWNSNSCVSNSENTTLLIRIVNTGSRAY